MSGSIRLHSELGVNPRLMICPVCGSETTGIALLGTANYIYHCGPCSINYVGPPAKCPKCKIPGTRERELGEYEKIVDQQPCDKCRKMQAECNEEVRKGGIYWRCKTCNSEGAVKAEHEIAKAVRKHFKLEPPEPCGVEWDMCPVCSDKGSDD